MRKVRKYIYNTATSSYERWSLSWRQRLWRLVGFVSASTVTGFILALLAFRFLASPSEKRIQAESQRLQEYYATLQDQLSDVDRQLTELEDRDNGVYRAVFAADPLPDSIREGKEYALIARRKSARLSTDELINRMQAEVAGLQRRIAVQRLSYDTLERLARAKEEMLARIPAIQPVSNKDLSRIASGFGYRIDPVYKTPKLHAGLDFAAPLGTPIYATADGKVATASFDESGYGNHVILDHGFRYKTLYGHMIRVKVRPCQQVKRGELIGWVGSTGKSTGPHCHYEVIFHDQKVDPIHYLFNDLSAQDYEKLVKLAAVRNQSFD